MADAVLLSQETYDKLKKLLDDYDNGFRDSIQLGEGLKREEEGTCYVKIGIDGTECPTA